MSRLLLSRITQRVRQIRSVGNSSLAEEQWVEVPPTYNAWQLLGMFVAFPTCGYLLYKQVLGGEIHAEDGESGESTARPDPITGFIYTEEERKNKEDFDILYGWRRCDPSEYRKENFITAWLRKKQEDHLKASWKVRVQSMRDSYQQTMEHIERKKFPQYPALPSYAKLYSNPHFDPHDPKKRLAGSFDD